MNDQAPRTTGIASALPTLPGPLVLASASPRRSQLLSLLGIPFEIDIAAIDESPRDGEHVAELVRRLAAEKAAVVAGRRPGSVVIGADTVVALDDESLGTPANESDAAEMLRRLSGRTHQVLTAVAVVTGEQCVTGLDQTNVTFGPIDQRLIEAYVATGEPLDKAGGYGLQGAGGVFVRHLEGTAQGVIGLPLALTLDLLGSLFAESGTFTKSGLDGDEFEEEAGSARTEM